MPKKIGLEYSDKLAIAMVNIIDIVIKGCKSFIIILKSSTNFIVNLFRIKEKKLNDEEELKSIITDFNLKELDKQLLLNIFEFSDTTIDKVMTLRKDVITININSSNEEILSIIKNINILDFQH